jgi:hypothetical protein
MLTILGQRVRMCDSVSRRTFLRIGGLGAAGLSLADVLRLEARAATIDPETRVESGSGRQSIIMVFLPGGPSHIDLLDLKSAAPAEIRGEFQPIATAVPGIEIGELLPRLAARMDKLAVLRGVVGGPDDHACHMCLTGHARLGAQPPGNWPSLGAVVSQVQGTARSAVPPSVGLAARMLHPPYNDPGPGFLGAAHRPFTPDGECRDNMLLKGIDLNRLSDRRSLLGGLDRFRRAADASGMVDGMDAFQQQAFGLLTGTRLAEALDLSREPARVRAMYGPGDPGLVEGFNAAPRLTEQFLIARRLVEAGVRCVTLAFGGWDWHERNFIGLRQQAPYLDQGLAALVDDVHDRGLDRDVAVVVWGEFGRSPRINQTAGRDHWPGASCALLAGGGWRTGQAIGATNRLGEVPRERPVHVQEVFATIYRHLGIDAVCKPLRDLLGRPQYLVENHRPIAELG